MHVSLDALTPVQPAFLRTQDNMRSRRSLMYYTWNWWWFVSWFTPMLLLLWVIFGWNSRRYWRSRDDYLRYRDDWGDDIRPPRDPRRFGNRGRGPRNYVRAD